MSNYAGFHVYVEDENGRITAVPSVSVKISNSSGTLLTTVTTDSNGYISPGTVSVSAGTRIRFRVENYNGLAGSCSQVTT